MKVLIANMEEIGEIEYILKKEMEEILLDMTDSEVDCVVKNVIKERYKTLSQLYRKCSKVVSL